MLTWEDDLEVHALRRRGWSISAIARHTGFDRKTVRKYLAGGGEPGGVRARSGPDPFDPFVDYVTARLTEDPHLWARTLFDELEQLGVRPVVSEPDAQHPGPGSASGVRGVPHGHTAPERGDPARPPGEETQWDWLELPDPPASWGWGKTAHLLVGSLAHSGKWRAALAPSEGQPHLVACLDRVTRGLGGGVTRVWRF